MIFKNNEFPPKYLLSISLFSFYCLPNLTNSELTYTPKSTDFNFAITLTNVNHNPKLQEATNLFITSFQQTAETSYKLENTYENTKRFQIKENTVSSRFNPNDRVIFHMISDSKSFDWFKQKIQPVLKTIKFKLHLEYHDEPEVSKSLSKYVTPLQKHFGNHAYYNKPLFFLSVGIHKILPEVIGKIVQIDVDVKFKISARAIFDQFQRFSESNVLGIVFEQQPVYQHLVHNRKYVGTGGYATKQQPGYNSGILLHDLTRQRTNLNWQKYLKSETIESLVLKYKFKGHLGDQDFFTLIGWEDRTVFYEMPCEWNRQLCEYWKKAYGGTWEEFHLCEAKAKILHGNCQTEIERYDTEEFEEASRDEL